MLGASNSDNAALAHAISDFAELMTPAKARWEYALSRTTYKWQSPRTGEISLQFNARTLPVVARFLGASVPMASLRLRRIRDNGFEDAAKWFTWEDDPMAVGPMEPWQIGHVYFAKVRGFPHVAKVGFSRRVRERIEDIESKAKAHLVVDTLKVGTLADEHWWHHNWRSLHIAGEWFYWPKSTERSLPAFLQPEAVAA